MLGHRLIESSEQTNDDNNRVLGAPNRLIDVRLAQIADGMHIEIGVLQMKLWALSSLKMAI